MEGEAAAARDIIVKMMETIIIIIELILIKGCSKLILFLSILTQPSEGGTIIPILPMRRTRHRLFK